MWWKGSAAVDVFGSQRGQADTESAEQNWIDLSASHLLSHPHALSDAEDRAERKMSVSPFILSSVHL